MFFIICYTFRIMDKDEQIKDILTRTVDEVIDHDDLKKKLESGEKLRVKLGIDPTSPNLHIGRAIALWKLRAFQELGHQVILLIGDFTALIGDTSDKNAERPMLSEEQVQSNLKDYLKQAFLILDKSKTEVRFNSDWLKKLTFMEVCKLADLFSLNEFASRENIAVRFESGKRVSLRELMYPLMQGYDSIALEADVELGGTDQRFNLLAGRKIQEYYGKPIQNLLMMGIIQGLDGRKMSSSWGNTINLLDEPNDMFGKVMTLDDSLIRQYFVSCTRLSMDQIDEFLNATTHPRDQKLQLAFEITKLYHGEDLAASAKAYFINTFTFKQLPDDMEVRKLNPGSYDLAELIFEAGLVKSKSEAKRVITQKGVKINQKTPEDDKIIITDKNDMVIQVGKRKFIRIL